MRKIGKVTEDGLILLVLDAEDEIESIRLDIEEEFECDGIRYIVRFKFKGEIHAQKMGI